MGAAEGAALKGKMKRRRNKKKDEDKKDEDKKAGVKKAEEKKDEENKDEPASGEHAIQRAKKCTPFWGFVDGQCATQQLQRTSRADEYDEQVYEAMKKQAAEG